MARARTQPAARENKLKGRYLTPEPLALYLSRWVAKASPVPKRVLEPGCGDGVFLRALAGLLPVGTELLGIDRYPSHPGEAGAPGTPAGSRILHCDFIEWSLSALQEPRRYDAIVGNPPYVRYQDLDETVKRHAARLFERAQLPYVGHTNLWAIFLLACILLLRPGGRLALVLPSELLHVTYAQPFRDLLLTVCSRVQLVVPDDNWFDGTLQGVVLLLAEYRRLDNEARSISLHRTARGKLLSQPPDALFDWQHCVSSRLITGKWTGLWLDRAEQELLAAISEMPAFTALGKLARVEVGMVTGASSFFFVTLAKAVEYGLLELTRPALQQARHCPGIVYNEYREAVNRAQGINTLFVDFGNLPPSGLTPAQRAYIASGEAAALHQRYKCRIRTPWYKVPGVKTAKVLLPRRVDIAPKLIHNTLGAVCTDALYLVTLNGQCTVRQVTDGFLNSLTALSAEVEGRYYGGGVLELTPSEAAKVLLPIPPTRRARQQSLDRLYRHTGITDVLSLQDNRLLRGAGLSQQEISVIQGARDKLAGIRNKHCAGDSVAGAAPDVEDAAA